jgi:hypothetical protein
MRPVRRCLPPAAAPPADDEAFGEPPQRFQPLVRERTAVPKGLDGRGVAARGACQHGMGGHAVRALVDDARREEHDLPLQRTE